MDHEIDGYFAGPLADQSETARRRTLKETHMERDVVCGMQVDPANAAGRSEYNGKTYYFCSKICKSKFDADPKLYAK